MTNWNTLPPELRTLAARVCTPKELDAWKLSLDGAGYRRVGLALGISPDTARDRLERARRKIAGAIDTPNEQEQTTMTSTIPFDPETGTMIVPIRVDPPSLQALMQGADVTGYASVQIVPSQHGDYTLSFNPLAQPEPEPEPEKPSRATRRRTPKSKAA